MVFFLYGEDSFRSNEKLKEIKNKFLGSANHAGLSIFDLAEEKNPDILAAFNSQGLFSDKKLILIKNLIISGDKEKQQEILDLFKNKKLLTDKVSVVVFWESQLPRKNNALFKYFLTEKNLKKQEFPKLKGGKLDHWIKERIKEMDEQIVISNKALEKLIAYCGEDMFLLSNEIDKLVDFSGGKEITEKIVDQLVKASLTSNIFLTIDALGVNDKKQALDLLLNHFKNGDDPLYLLSMFIYQFRNLLIIADAEKVVTSETELSKVTGLHPFVIKKSLTALRNFSFIKLKNVYSRLAQIDSEAKTGKVDIRLALEKFIVEL